MTVAEVALAVMLVAGAGWLVRSFDNLRTIDPGFDADGRLLFDAAAMGPKLPDNVAVMQRVQRLARARLRSADRAWSAPARRSTFRCAPVPRTPCSSTSRAIRMRRATYNSRQRIVSPGFFAAMGIKLIAGRDFNGDDRPGSPPWRSSIGASPGAI